MFAPIAWIRRCTYCLPVSPIVTTRMRDAVPITMPSAVSAKRTLLLLKVSYAKLRISASLMLARCASNLERGADATGGRQSTGGWVAGVGVAWLGVVRGGVVVAMLVI